MSVLLQKSYWLFLLKSTNEHGVHSPFVYDLVTRCFYNKKETNSLPKKITKNTTKPLKTKHINLLNRIIDYLKITKIAGEFKITHLLTQLTETEKNIITTQYAIADLIFIPKNSQETKQIDQLKPNALAIIELPYSNKDFWKSIKSHKNAHVVVDTYYFGFIFNRKQQAKEEFYIRL